jgi:ATP-dependent DNA helicase RecG
LQDKQLQALPGNLATGNAKYCSEFIVTDTPALDMLPISTLKGVGHALADKLGRLSIYTVQDLLFHLPFRYQDRSHLTPASKARLGDFVQLEAEIVSSKIVYGKRRSLQCTVIDGSGAITLRFFFFNTTQQKSLAVGNRIRCYGEVRRGRTGFEIYHPEYRLLREDSSEELQPTLTAIYPATEGLHQARLRSLLQQAVKLLQRPGQVSDYLPPEILAKLNYMELTEAIRFVHQPPTDVDTEQMEAGQHPAQRRLAFEELLSHRLCMRRLRNTSNTRSAPVMRSTGKLTGSFLSGLAFKLTRAQQKVIREISDDLANGRPMLRLLQGDVGSGKTVVAAMAALQAVEAGFQVAIMAPTEILAEQHCLTFNRWFAGIDIGVGWLSGKLTGKKREQQLAGIRQGDAGVIIGTHALFQEGVDYARLGLVIVDEQHRFGVHQRMSLREKADISGLSPHQLVMTATPIPRTLAMSAYADLDCSVIDELPPGRIPITTLLAQSERRSEIITRISQSCAAGQQAYWVCTLIEESEALQCQAAEATAESLSSLLPELKIALVHGRMKSREKTAVMERFKAGEIQLLVATTVIEVGVDVPNANLMVIENAERLGLAQLHQLRGRVGRGGQPSYCVLLFQTPLSEAGKQRLAVMKQSTDGFFIAERDLQIRGPGQVLGTAQTGLMSFRVADIARDADLLEDVRNYSELIMQKYPERVEPLVKRWLGDREYYGKV